MLLNAKFEYAGYGGDGFKLVDVGLSVDEGSSVLIVGGSGSGKSTLFLALTGALSNLLNGDVKGYSIVRGVDLVDAEGFTSVAKLVGIVLQDPDKQIAMSTPYDEVGFTLENLGYSEELVRKLVAEILERFGLRDKMFYEVEELSGGEKRRLTLASAIVHKPPLLLFDEPTASMDPWGISDVREFIVDQLRSGRSSIVIEHKARYFMDLVDEIVLIDNGRIRARRKTSELSRDFVDLLIAHGVDVSKPTISRRGKGSYSEGRVLLETTSLTVGYGERVVLSEVNLDVREREVVALVGPNGSGKTSLLKTIAGFIKPLGGEVKGKCNSVVYVPQNPDYMFLYTSVKGELEYIRSKAGEGFLEELNRESPWLRRVLDLSPHKLSHGQRRWLALAIARSLKPCVILLDEPTTGLDLTLYEHLKKWIKTLLKHGIGVVVSTHDPRIVADLANRVYMVSNGRVREVSLDHALEWLEAPLR